MVSISCSGTSKFNADQNYLSWLSRSRYDTDGQNAVFTGQQGTAGSMVNTAFKKEEFRTLAEVNEQGLGLEERVDYFSLRASVVYIKPVGLSYPACPADKCAKKMTMDTNSEQWRCEKCDKFYPAPEHRWVNSYSLQVETLGLILQTWKYQLCSVAFGFRPHRQHLDFWLQ